MVMNSPDRLRKADAGGYIGHLPAIGGGPKARQSRRERDGLPDGRQGIRISACNSAITSRVSAGIRAGRFQLSTFEVTPVT
jgi:hypothetical protein